MKKIVNHLFTLLIVVMAILTLWFFMLIACMSEGRQCGDDLITRTIVKIFNGRI